MRTITILLTVTAIAGCNISAPYVEHTTGERPAISAKRQGGVTVNPDGTHGIVGCCMPDNPDRKPD